MSGSVNQSPGFFIDHLWHAFSPEAPGHIKFLIPPSEVLRQHFLPTESISQVQWVQASIALHIVPLKKIF